VSVLALTAESKGQSDDQDDSEGRIECEVGGIKPLIGFLQANLYISNFHPLPIYRKMMYISYMTYMPNI